MHALNGNINGWWGLAAAASAPIALQLHRGVVHVVEDSMHAVATVSADVVEEIGHGARRTVWVAGTAITLVVVILCGAVLWYVSRAVANRIAHMRHGNTAAPEARLSQLLGSEATFEVASSKKGVTHKVWVHLKEETAACGCRAYLAEGRCGHCDAAMDTARSLGFLHAAQRGAGPALTDSIRSTASEALAKGKVVLGLGTVKDVSPNLRPRAAGSPAFRGSRVVTWPRPQQMERAQPTHSPAPCNVPPLPLWRAHQAGGTRAQPPLGVSSQRSGIPCGRAIRSGRPNAAWVWSSRGCDLHSCTA